MLYEKILELQAIELSYWKRGLESNLSTLKEAVKKGIKVEIYKSYLFYTCFSDPIP